MAAGLPIRPAAETDPASSCDHIRDFRRWVARHRREWIVRPPVTTFDAGRERIAFVLLRDGAFFGIFSSPMHALIKIGDPDLTEAFQRLRLFGSR